MIEIEDLIDAGQDYNPGFWAPGETCPTQSLSPLPAWTDGQNQTSRPGKWRTTLYATSLAKNNPEGGSQRHLGAMLAHRHLHTADSFNTCLSPLMKAHILSHTTHTGTFHVDGSGQPCALESLSTDLLPRVLG